MIFVISPAKSLDFQTPLPVWVKATEPLYLPQAAQLVALLKKQSVEEIAAFMELSNALAELNVARFKAWRKVPALNAAKPAMLAFDGDVYDGLSAKTLKSTDMAWAQQHVRILSGLYGVLRPLDLIQPYRLEMGRALANAHGSNLYRFWGDTQTTHLNDAFAGSSSPEPILVNLASAEYFKSIKPKALNARVLECVFEDFQNGRYKVISFNAKRARGMMARFAVQRKIASVKRLQAFSSDGYLFAAAASTPDRMVFRRNP